MRKVEFVLLFCNAEFWQVATKHQICWRGGIQQVKRKFPCSNVFPIRQCSNVFGQGSTHLLTPIVVCHSTFLHHSLCIYLLHLSKNSCTCTYSTSKLLVMLPTQSNFVLLCLHASVQVLWRETTRYTPVPPHHMYVHCPLFIVSTEKHTDSHLRLHIYMCPQFNHCVQQPCSLCPSAARQGKSEQFIAMPCYTKMCMYK